MAEEILFNFPAPTILELFRKEKKGEGKRQLKYYNHPLSSRTVKNSLLQYISIQQTLDSLTVEHAVAPVLTAALARRPLHGCTGVCVESQPIQLKTNQCNCTFVVITEEITVPIYK